MVLRGSTEKSDTTDVDLLDSISERAAGLRDSLGEGVQVADDDGDGRDGLRLQILLIGGDGAGEDTFLTVNTLNLFSMWGTYRRARRGGESLLCRRASQALW